MKPGDRIIVEVLEVRDNGIFFEYAGKSAIVNVTELTWDETGRAWPPDFASAGDQLEVVITAVGPESLGASIKRLDPSANPWLDSTLVVGARHPGRLSRRVSWGLFADLDIGLVALLDDLTPDMIQLPAGIPITVELTKIDRAARKLGARLLDEEDHAKSK